jgi:hypothetical protein
MNLADYLSELLGQQDEVSVPGLGYFVRSRINAHYSDSEARFYPPYHQVKFVPQAKEDDTFAQYVADNKNISLASSKYFVEKFIGKLKEDAAQGKYLFADLGSFQTEQGQLVFKPNDRIPADPAFYGYPPVAISKVGAPLSVDTKKPVFNQTQTAATAPPATASPQPVQTIAQPEYYEEEVEPKKRVSVWLIILIAVVLLVAGVAVFFKLNPEVFDKVKDKFEKLTGKTAVVTPVVKPVVKPDTTKKTAAIDTSKQKIVAPKDTVKPSKFEIIIGNYASPTVAETAVKYFKRRGVEAKILTLSDAPGPLIKVSGGTFGTNDSARNAMNDLIKKRRIKPSSYTLEIKPQQ